MHKHLTVETFANLTLPLVDGSQIKIALSAPTDTQLSPLRLIEQAAEMMRIVDESLNDLCVTMENADRLRAIIDYVRAG